MQTYKAFREPTPYEVEKQRAERQRRYAELLQQQAMAPEEEPYTFQGFRAMPSPANALSRVLQAYAAKKVGEKAEQAEAKAREADVAGMTELQRSLGPQTRVVEPDMFADPMGMASKYTPPVTETTMPTYQQRETLLTNALASGTPSAQRLAQLMLSRQPQISLDALMEASEESRRKYEETGDPSVLRKPAKPAESLIGKPSPSDFTPASLAKFSETGNYADLDAIPKQPLIGSIDLGNKGSAEAQKIFLGDIGTMRPRANAAKNIIKSVNNLDRLTQKGTYTGALAAGAVGAGQFLNSLGIEVDPETLKNTEAFSAQASDLVLSTQAALGGARGFTKEETAILMQMFPQIINSPQARVAIGNIMRNKQLDVIDEYDSLIDDYYSTYKDSKIPYKKIDDEEVRYQRWKRSQGGL